MSKETYSYNPDYAVAPGETLRETMEILGLSNKELSIRMGRPEKTISEILNGNASITADTAIQLEKVTNVPASFWNNAEATYRERTARIKENEALESQKAWLDLFPYKAMVDLCLVCEVKEPVERVRQLLNFFGVASDKQWTAQYGDGAVIGTARAADGYKNENGDLSVWLRVGEILAQRRETQPYDEARFLDALKQVRLLTRQNPASVWGKVCELCASAGVALVLVPELPNIHVNGFTRWLSPNKAIIQLSDRQKRDDVLWFSFFHEAAHLLKHGKKEKFIELPKMANPKEQEADQWAGGFLIPERAWKAFTSSPKRKTEAEITSFAESIGVANSIVHGRLQREQLLPQSFHNHLRMRVEIAWKGLV